MGTLVLTESGYKNIEEIKEGDIVIATDPETGKTEVKEVKRIFENKTFELVHLTVNGETITSTPGHKYYAPEKGWTSAIDLAEGDLLQLVNGAYVVVECVQHEILETPVTIYNFEVEDFHTYYVGKQSVLVHNKDCTKVYYHVTTADNAKKIMESGQLTSGPWESRVFAWTEQPTRRQAKLAGIGTEADTVIRFETSTSFEPDIGNQDIASIKNIVVQTSDAQRLPISIKNAEVVGFKKEWWQFWKK